MILPLIKRRMILRGLMYSPLASLAGCGSSRPTVFSEPTDNTAPSGAGETSSVLVTEAKDLAKAFVTYYHYSGDQLVSVQDGLDVQAAGTSLTEDRFGSGDVSYEFDGLSSLVTVSGFTSFPTGDFAVLLWVKLSDTSPMDAFAIKTATGDALVLQANNDSALAVVWNGAVALTTGLSGELVDGVWHHIAIQRYRGGLSVFIDGIQRGQRSGSGVLPANSTMIFGGVTGLKWSGAIDDVRLYDRAFSPAVMPQAVYAWTQVKAPTLDGNLEAFFPFNGNAVNDLGHGGDATVYNAVLAPDRYGSPNTAYQFNGSDAYIAVLDSPYISTAADFAICFWEQSSAQVPMAALSVTPGGSSLDVVFNSGAGISVFIGGILVPALNAGNVGSFTDGAWHFVLLQRVGDNFQLYADGTLLAQAPNDAIIFGDGSVVQFGKGSGSGGAPGVNSYWNGALDDIQIYDNSLSGNEMPALQTLQFRGRDGAGALVFQDKMWLLGGWNPPNTPVCNNQVWSSSDGLNWVLVTDAPWEGRHDAGYAVYDNKLWVIGGDRNTGHYQNNVWSSVDGLNWELVTDSVPWANRATQYVLVFNNRLWLMGGQEVFETTTPVVAYNDVYSSADGANWTLETASAGWSPRGLIMGSAVFKNRMWVVGGGTYDVPVYQNDVWSSADGVNWDLVLASAPWSKRVFHNIITFDNKLWVIAGSTGTGGLNDVWYSHDGAVWVQLLGTPWIPRHAASTFVFAGKLWIAAGSDASTYDDVWSMNYAT
jgi:hypothetical protein